MGGSNFQFGRNPLVPGLPPSLSPEAVRQQLSRLLQHPSFADSARSRQLIEYLVERVLHGDAGDLKEYALAADVFERGSDFDPKLDSIVRAQVSRLRVKLQEYYQGDGRHDPVRIDLPRRGYVVQLRANSSAPLVELVPANTKSKAEYKARSWYWTACFALVAVAALAIAIGIARKTPHVTPTLSLTRLLPEEPPILTPSLSRDGKLLAYSIVREDGTMDLHVQHMGGGGQPLQITHDPGVAYMPSFSPDGSQIVFACEGLLSELRPRT